MKRVLLNSVRLGLLMALILTFSSGVVLAQQNLDARLAMHAKGPFAPTKTIVSLCPTFDRGDSLNDPSDDLPLGSYDPNWEDIACQDYNVTYSIGGEFPGPEVYVVLGQATSGILGVSFGVEYAMGGLQSGPFVVWDGCADGLEFPNIGPFGVFPARQGGIRITWETCQDGTDFRQGADVINGSIHIVLGAFYIYIYGEEVLELTANNNLESGPELAVTACAGGTTDFLDFVDPSLLSAILPRVHILGNGSQGYTPCGDIVLTKETTWGKIKTLYGEESK